MNFKEYANSFQTEINLRLENITALTEKLGNPQNKLKCIHVAGTNGKGSVCAFLQSIFTVAGYKTGKFISPNLIDVCERISIDGENIDKSEMDKLLEYIEAAVKEIEQERGLSPSQFEIWTAAAFLYFARKKCDIVVLETGLGGRFDATNIIKKPLCSVITRIAMDHMQFLGTGISQIAFEKGGIIKDGCPVVTIHQNGNADTVLYELSEKHGSPLYYADEVINNDKEGFCEIFDCGKFKNLKTRLWGLHQTENASLAIKTALILGIDEKCIRFGLERAKNPARLELISENPPVVFDGAHNESGAEALSSAINRYFYNQKMSIIYGAMADKDIEPILECFKRNGFHKNSIIYTVSVKDNSRAKSAEALLEDFRSAGFLAYACKNFGEAYLRARQENCLTVICGSLYLYKDMMEYRSTIK